jgi:hypothetical protein
MSFHTESHDDGMLRTVRTEISMEERQRLVLLLGSPLTDLKICPLCGNPLFPVIDPVTEAQPEALVLRHSEGQRRCPGPDKADEMQDPQQRED